MSEPNVGKRETPIARDWTAWTLLAAIVLWAALAGPFFAGRIYTAEDLGASHVPLRAFYSEQLENGQSYDWMPRLFSGYFLTGQGQFGPYHPAHRLLYGLLPLRAALAWESLAPYPLMLIGAWLFLRRRLGRNDAAMFGALAFTFSSFNLLHFVQPGSVAVVAHLPWLLWSIDVAMVDSRRWRVAGATALIALGTGSQLLLGCPQFVWFSLIAEATYVIYLETAHKYAARAGCSLCATCDDCVGCTVQTWPRVLIAKGIGLLIGGVQLLPSLDAWWSDARWTIPADAAMFGSLHPLNLVQLVGPYLLAGRVVGDNPHEFAMYLGVVPLVLCVWAVARQSELGPLTKWVWSAFAFGMLMLLLSFGQYGFLYRIMTWLPIVGEFGYPARYLMLFQVAACAMATAGFVLLIRENQLARRQREAGINYVERRTLLALWRDFEPLWCLVGVSAAVAVAGIKMRHEPYMASVPAILAGPALVSAAVVLLVAAARGRSSALVGLVLLAAFDLGMYGLSGSGFRHNANWKDYVASAQLPPGDPDGRVLVSLAQPEMLDRRTGDLMTLFGWRRADGYSSHAPRRQLDYRLLPSLRVAGVRWVGYDASTWQIAGLKPYNDKWLETPDPLPRARMVARTLQTANPAEDISRIAPDTTALVEFPLALPVSTPGKAELTADRPGFLSVRVECPAAQLLVVAESYHEGWRASIDSRPVEVFRVYGDFMGCLVEPGKHHVNFVFRPTSLQRGKMASGVGLGLLAICFFGSLTGPQRRRSPQGLG